MKTLLWGCVIVGLSGATAHAANTVLDFSQIEPMFNGDYVPVDYGTALPDTPLVAANWGGNRGIWQWWSEGYGDLNDGPWLSWDGPDPPQPHLFDLARITLAADPGNLVTLHSFDMARYVSYNDSQNALNSLQVVANNAVVWSAPVGEDGRVHLLTGSSHSSFDFPAGITGQVVHIEFTSDQLINVPTIGSVTIKNIEFSQSVNAHYTEGDANFDGLVNGQDIALIATNWLTTGLGTPGDANNDRLVNGQDIALVATNWLDVAPAAAVPEPASWLIAALALAGVAVSRRQLVKS